MGLPESPSVKTGYGSATYRLVTEGKMLAVREILKAGVHVFFADVDLVLNRNPLADIRGDVRSLIPPRRLRRPLEPLIGSLLLAFL